MIGNDWHMGQASKSAKMYQINANLGLFTNGFVKHCNSWQTISGGVNGSKG